MKCSVELLGQKRIELLQGGLGDTEVFPLLVRPTCKDPDWRRHVRLEPGQTSVITTAHGLESHTQEPGGGP